MIYLPNSNINQSYLKGKVLMVDYLIDKRKMNFDGLTPSDWSCASKILNFQDFEIFGVMKMLACVFITRLIRNGQP